MLEIIYALSCIVAGVQLGFWFHELVVEDLKTGSKEASLGTLLAFVALAMFPIFNSIIALLALQKVPLVWSKRKEET